MANPRAQADATAILAESDVSATIVDAAPVAIDQSGPTMVRRLSELCRDSGPTVACRGGAPPLDDRLIWILDAPNTTCDPPLIYFARKERDLGNAFAELTAAQAGHLHARLTLRLGNDLVAIKFARLSEERRSRLLAFLRLCAERG